MVNFKISKNSQIFWEVIILLISIFIFLSIFIPSWFKITNRMTELERKNILLEEKISDLKIENKKINQRLKDALNNN